jgi:hypothetical protein
VRVERYRDALRSALASETKAYGFTLVVWGTGSIVTAERGSPGRSGVAAYVGGLLAGMALTIVAAGGAPASGSSPRRRRRYAVGAVHLVSVAAAIAAGFALALVVAAHWLAYLLAGVVAAAVYQFALGLEVAFTTEERDTGAGSDRADPVEGTRR